METTTKNAQVICHLMRILQNLHRHKQGVRFKVVVHHSMKDVHLAIITGRGKERVPLMKGHGFHSICVIPYDLVSLAREIQVKPFYS